MITVKLNKSLGYDTDGKEIIETKTYVAPAPKARLIRAAAEMTESFDTSTLKTADLDAMIEFMVELFGRKFTADDVWDGLDADKLVPTVTGCISRLTGNLNNKIGAIPNGQAE